MSARDMSISGLSAAVAFAVAFALTTATGALAYHTHFVQNNCFVKGGISIYPKSRYASLDWGYTAAYEGYQWGGGCWNMNDVDDSPGDPTEDPATGGEGPDCSGLVFKSWFESSDQTRTDFWKWSTYNFVHGPYTAGAFKSGAGAANVTTSKSTMAPDDAFASSTHIGLLYAQNFDGTDLVLEAKGESYGSGVWTRTYRGSTRYSGVRRVGWVS